MILKTYLFAQSAGIYQQYISDYSETFIRSVCRECKTESQIAIHRDGNLMYYVYAYQVSNSEILGICIVCGEVCKNIQGLFDFLHKSLEQLAKKGVVLYFNEYGKIKKKVDKFANEPAEIDSFFRDIKFFLEKNTSFWELLPPEDLTIPLDSSIILSFSEDEKSKIIEAIRHYHNIYISIENMVPSSFSRTIARLHSNNSELGVLNNSLKEEISRLRNKQRNTLWVSVLALIVIIMGITIYFKVINPSQVSKYQTPEFVYYGPLNNRKPHGEGVAFYPKDDSAGRRYYIGNFENGDRQDTEAMLYYQNGDYYYGIMDGDEWKNGVFYSTSDNSHFVGSFKNNTPYNGTWYRHEEAYKLKEGKPVW